MSFEENITQSQNLAEQFLGSQIKELESFDQFEQLLKDDNNQILLTVKWKDSTHQLVAERVFDNRVFFFNPIKSPGVPEGELVGGEDGTPARRVEALGLESFTYDELLKLNKAGHLRAHLV